MDKEKRPSIGRTFFHPHPLTEKYLGVDKDHVLIDRQDYEMVLGYLLSDTQRFMSFIAAGRKIVETNKSFEDGIGEEAGP